MMEGAVANRNAQSWDVVLRLAGPILAGEGGRSTKTTNGSLLSQCKSLTANEIRWFCICK